MAFDEIIYQILATAILWFGAKWAYNRIRRRRVLIVADDPQVLEHEFEDDRVQIRRLSDVRALRDITLYRPDAVVVDYNYQDRSAGRQLIRVCEINRIPALIVCGQADTVTNHMPNDIARKDDKLQKKINDWLTMKCA